MKASYLVCTRLKKQRWELLVAFRGDYLKVQGFLKIQVIF